MNKTITDLVGEDYKKWEKGDCIIFNASTGSGKTYFIENVLAKYCNQKILDKKKILFLCNRAELSNDVRQEVERLGLKYIINVITYQGLQNKINEGEDLQVNYDYIVYDEAHYLISEGWNNNTDRIFKFFEENTEKYVHIFMSGTGHNIFSWLKYNKYVKENNEYIIPYSYTYVEKVIFYNNDNKVEELFDDLQENEKIIYFCNKLETAYQTFKKYEDRANFICSKYCKYKEFNQNCIKKYNKDLITFDKQILIATTALDVGVTIKDKNIKYIITDLVEINALQQCLGRKRVVDNKDYCTFYIKNHAKKTLNGYLATLNNNILKDAEEYYHNRKEFILNSSKKRNIANNPCFQFSKSEIDNNKNSNSKIGNVIFNYYTYAHYIVQRAVLKNCIKQGFDKCVLDKLGNTITDIEYQEEFEEKQAQDALTLYLNGIVGKKLFKDEQKELIEKIGLRDCRNRLQKDYKIFNAYFESNNMFFIILNKRGSERIDDKVKSYRYWEVINNVV